mgnify:CR=1 FL=1
MGIQYTNNSAKVKAAMKGSITAFLHEAAGEIQAQTVQLSRTDTGQTKGSYETKVVIEGDSGTAYIGSNYQNAIWEEFGTGIYALNGDGRKDVPWVYYDETGQKHVTSGKQPKRMLWNAFQSLQSKIQQMAEGRFGGMG